MKKMNQPNSAQQGFTLIELIMVIVILGILSAFALPKFADLSSNAEGASIKAALGAVKSGSAIAHAQWLAEGDSTSTEVTLEGTAVTMASGYPDQDDLADLVDLADYVVNTASTATIISLQAALGSPCFSYTNGGPPTISAVGSVATAASGATTTCS
ncbi:MAG: MSHA pilin protein MshA [Psychrobacter glaciei]|jgi:MSHA pilin protein MshA